MCCLSKLFNLKAFFRAANKHQQKIQTLLSIIKSLICVYKWKIEKIQLLYVLDIREASESKKFFLKQKL